MYIPPPFPFRAIGARVLRLVFAAALGAALFRPVVLGSQLTIVKLEGRPLTQVAPAPARTPVPRQGPAPPITARTVGVIAWLYTALATLWFIMALGMATFAGMVTLALGFVPLLIAALVFDLAARRFARLRSPWSWIPLGIAVAAPYGPLLEATAFSSYWLLGWPLNLLPAGFAGACTGAVVYGVLRGAWRTPEPEFD